MWPSDDEEKHKVCQREYHFYNSSALGVIEGIQPPRTCHTRRRAAPREPGNTQLIWTLLGTYSPTGDSIFTTSKLTSKCSLQRKYCPTRGTSEDPREKRPRRNTLVGASPFPPPSGHILKFWEGPLWYWPGSPLS